MIAAMLASVQHVADVPEPVEDEGELSHQGHVFTMLHNMAALQAFCKHIGSVRKQAVMPCPPGATHPCCTKRQMQMAKMQGSQPANFNWADPTSWSGSKGAAASHLAHKASVASSGIAGMASPGANNAWQTAAPAPAPMLERAPMYAPQQQMYAQPPPQQGYYPHLLPGQPGVPEAGAVAPMAYQQAYSGGGGAAAYGNYVAPQQGPAMPYQQAPMYAPQQQMYAPPVPQYAPPPQGYAPQYAPQAAPMAPQGYAPPA